MKKSLPAILTFVAAIALSSCAWFTDPAADQPQQTSAPAAASADANKFVVKTDFTPLYRTGPQQPNGPDQSLPKNTLVTLLKRSFGFSRVQLENGLDGYVATEDLEPAPAELINPPTAIVSQSNVENNSAIVQRFSADRAERSAAVSTSNAEALPELPEPRLEPEPTPVNKPDFRY